MCEVGECDSIGDAAELNALLAQIVVETVEHFDVEPMQYFSSPPDKLAKRTTTGF